MAQSVKEFGFLWAFCVSCLLINADERGKRFIVDQSCDMFAEYKELLALEHDGHCHSFDSVIHKLRDMHEAFLRLGSQCMHEVIGKMATYYTSLNNNKTGGCKCSGNVAYHPQSPHHQICKNKDHNYDVLYGKLFGNDSNTGPCLLHNEVWAILSSLPRHHMMDCQWEIIRHYNTIYDAGGTRCNCMHVTENMHVNETPTHPVLTSSISLAHTTASTAIRESTSPTFITTTNPTIHESVATVTAVAPHTCTKMTTISIMAHGLQQTNPNAGNCHPETNDHQAPEALVLNMCNLTGPETWTKGQNVMSVCASIPLYTPIATFSDGKYHIQEGHTGIFVGCLLDGFKIIVQECDKNITVVHATTGHQPDPANYSIIM